MAPPTLTPGWETLRATARRALGLPPGSEPLDDATTRRLGTALEALSAQLVGAPASASTAAARYLDAAEARAAYAVGLAPRTLSAVFRELPALPPNARVLDLGTGTGAGSLACLLRGARRFELLDHATTALADAALMLREAGAAHVGVHARSLTSPQHWPDGGFDLVLMAFSLLEASGDDAERAGSLVQAAIQRVAPHGMLLVVDSAQKSRARMINGLRETVLAAGLHLWSPCPHALPCPALERERDFCHAACRWELPEDLRQVGERAGLHRTRLVYSFLLAGRDERSTAVPSTRVIGDVQQEKGRARVAVCSSGPVRELMVLARHKEAHAAFRDLERGMGLTLPPCGERVQRIDHAELLTEGG